MKAKLSLPLILAALFITTSCQPNNPSIIHSQDDFSVPSYTPTPSAKTYEFEEVDPRQHGKKISIHNESELREFADKTRLKDEEYLSGSVELEADITLKSEWTPIANFKGQFNGKGHSIKGLSIKTSSIRQGLFSNLDGAKVGCLKLEGQIESADNSGMLAGYTIGDCCIVDVTVSGSVRSTSNVGGIIGIISSGSVKIVGCINKAEITGSGFIGGLVGSNNTYKINISDSANYGRVSANGAYVGGIIAMLTNNTAITNDYNIYQCFNYGQVIGSSYVGGVAGLSCAPIVSSGVGINGMAYRLDGGEKTVIKEALNFNTPYCGTVCGGIIRNVPNNALGELVECQNQDGFAITGINDAAGCTRIIKFKDRIMLFAATNKYAVSYDGGHTFGSFTTISGKNEERCPIDNQPSTDTGNTQPYILPDGRIAIMYRAIRIASNFSYSSLRMRISDYDGVFNPNDQPIVMIENYTSNTGTPGAFYEPYPIQVDDGRIVTYISEDVHYSEEYNKNGLYIPKLRSDLICAGGSQDTVMIPMRIADGATEVGEGKIEILSPELIFRGSNTDIFGHANSRPGMTVLTQLYDGSYAMTLENPTEAQNPGYQMVVQITYSRDGLTWTTPKTIIRPHHPGGSKNSNNQMYKCCAPFCATLPDGRLVITCATSEDYNGYYPNDTAHSDQEIAFITKNRIGYGDDFNRDDLIQVGNYYYNSNEYCVWASVSVIDGRIYISGLEGVNSKKDNGSIGSTLQWILLSTIHYEDLYQRLGLTKLS